MSIGGTYVSGIISGRGRDAIDECDLAEMVLRARELMDLRETGTEQLDRSLAGGIWFDRSLTGRDLWLAEHGGGDRARSRRIFRSGWNGTKHDLRGASAKSCERDLARRWWNVAGGSGGFSGIEREWGGDDAIGIWLDLVDLCWWRSAIGIDGRIEDGGSVLVEICDRDRRQNRRWQIGNLMDRRVGSGSEEVMVR